MGVGGDRILQAFTGQGARPARATAGDGVVLEPGRLQGVDEFRIELVAVVAAGLEPGMQVVATGVHVLSPGQKVTVYQSKQPVAPASKALAATENRANTPASAAPTAAPAAPQ